MLKVGGPNLEIVISSPKRTFQACAVSLLLPRTLKARLQRRNGNGETPASQSNQNSIYKSYLFEDYNPREITKLIFSHALMLIEGSPTGAGLSMPQSG
jgi:hypothetical protein